MIKHVLHHKGRFLATLSVLLFAGFITTSLVSYVVALSAVRSQIDSETLPLTSDNIYSEIQRDLLKPVFISSLMANDTFLRDWVLEGEQDAQRMARYLKEIKEKYGAVTAFFVSETTRNYYYADGILKKVAPDAERDRWYFRVREMATDYETNVDPDLANKDTMTIFINHRVTDYDGNYIGATGVGLTTGEVMALIQFYGEKYGRRVYFIDPEGKIVLHPSDFPEQVETIQNIEGLSAEAESILASEGSIRNYRRDGKAIHLNSRFIPELNWFLMVEQTEGEEVGRIQRALVTNLLLCGLIASIAIVLTTLTVGSYQRVTLQQQEQIVHQHADLLAQNAKLNQALAEVRQLSGLLPICAWCKNVRDDQGYWQQIESYIQEHSEAYFSHGICPDCVQKHVGKAKTEKDGSEPA
jgi:hypothetical protein